MFGKWHLGDNWPLRPQDQGFDHVAWHHGGGVGQGPDYWGNDYFDDTYEVNGEWQPFEGYCTDVWFREATRFIEQEDERPFFAYLSTNAPHGPFLVADEYAQPYIDAGVAPRMARFYGMITNIDENVGRLRERLEELGLAENTILVFLTDNGTAAGHAPRDNEEATWPGYRAGMRGAQGLGVRGRAPRAVLRVLAVGRDRRRARRRRPSRRTWIVLPTLSELCGLQRERRSSPGRPIPGDAAAGRGPGARGPHALRPLPACRAPAQVAQECRDDGAVAAGQREGAVRPVRGPGPGERRRGRSPGARRGPARALRRLVGVARQPTFDGYVRIGLGGAENPAELMSHDWHTNDQGVPWHQDHVRNGYVVNGPWAVEVASAGEYEITLRRWPAHLERPMEMVHASVEVGGVEASSDVEPTATSATFRLQLPSGPTELLTTLRRTDGTEHGAYFASVRRLD